MVCEGELRDGSIRTRNRKHSGTAYKASPDRSWPTYKARSGLGQAGSKPTANKSIQRLTSPGRASIRPTRRPNSPQLCTRVAQPFAAVYLARYELRSTGRTGSPNHVCAWPRRNEGHGVCATTVPSACAPNAKALKRREGRGPFIALERFIIPGFFIATPGPASHVPCCTLSAGQGDW